MRQLPVKVFFRILLGFIGIAFLAHAGPAFAEKTRDFMQSGIEELMEIEVERVNGASKYEQNITEAPSSISIVTSDDIRQYGYRNLAEILRSVRGFYISYDRSYSYIGVRGFSRPGDYNTRILLLLNGHRLNDTIYDSAAIDDFVLDVDLIERIEVIRGAGSSLYGTSAFFAVVNVITRKGPTLQGAEVSATAGSFHTYTERLSYGRGFMNGASIMVSGSRLDSEGNSRLFFREFDSPATNNGIAGRADYEKSSNYFAEATFGEFTVTGGYVNRLKGMPTAAFETIFNTRKTFTADEHAFLELKYEHNFDPLTALTAKVSYDQYYYHGHYLYEPPFYVNKDFARGKWLSGELQLTKTVFDKHKLIGGAEFRNSFQQDQGNYDIAVYLDDKRRSSSLGLYAQDEFTITSSLMLNAGLRYDYSRTVGGAVNPRLALIYRPLKGTFLKYLFGTAFRAPNVYERYYGDDGSTQKGNPDLKPEKIYTHEVIIEQYFSNDLRATASAYYYRIRDLISQQIDPDDNLAVFRNTEEIRAHGIELEIEKRWRRGISSTVSYAYQKAKEIQTGETLTNSPKHLAKLNLLIPLIGKTLSTGTEVQYASTRRTLSGGQVASHIIANITLLGKNVIKGLDLSAGVHNAFNSRYRDPGGTEHQPFLDSIQQDGRNFRLKLTYVF